MEHISTGTRRRQRANGEASQPRGRKDKSGQEAVIKATELKDMLPELVKLKKAADDAAVELNDAIKKGAEKSGLLAAVVRRVVTAAAGENYEEEKRKAEQLSLAFEECEGAA